MSVIAEAITRLKLEAFEKSESYCSNEGFINIEEIEHTIVAVSVTPQQKIVRTSIVHRSLTLAVISFSPQAIVVMQMKTFSYLIDIFHILWDHELSLRKGDWELFKDAKKGYFVCNMTNRSTSGIGFDQALDKTYNCTS